ncbi:MAG: hypothetical protein NVS9B3_00960 [Gemmatimonadaceae bacterium]
MRDDTPIPTSATDGTPLWARPENAAELELVASYLSGLLGPAESDEVRNRLAQDTAFAELAAPLIDAFAAPPRSRDEKERSWQELSRRLGLDDGPAQAREAHPTAHRSGARAQGFVRLTSTAAANVDGAGPPRTGAGGRPTIPVPFRRRVVVAATAAAAALWLLVYVPHDPRRWAASARRWRAEVAEAYETGRAGEGVRLVDGTLVFARQGSRIDYDGFSRDRRVVRMSGAARFEVAGEGGAPFIVETANAAIATRGTVFVRVDSAATQIRTHVSLREGRAELWARDSGATPLLLQGHESAHVDGGDPPVRDGAGE